MGRNPFHSWSIGILVTDNRCRVNIFELQSPDQRDKRSRRSRYLYSANRGNGNIRIVDLLVSGSVLLVPEYGEAWIDDTEPDSWHWLLSRRSLSGKRQCHRPFHRDNRFPFRRGRRNFELSNDKLGVSIFLPRSRDSQSSLYSDYLRWLESRLRYVRIPTGAHSGGAGSWRVGEHDHLSPHHLADRVGKLSDDQQLQPGEMSVMGE